jgi:hypothetical protein
LEINVRNDELLVKLAAIVQKIISAENRVGSEEEFGLSESEKEHLLKTIVEHDTMDLQSASDKITKELSSKKD